MSDYLQKHLAEEAVKQSHLKLLESQWSFDQKLIPKALQQVGQLFPHYSRHDQSHSDQILINIERLLGERRIKMLSATDTWLLLEAAYWHDIGMVVPHRDLKDALESPEFQAYRRQIAACNGHDLQKFAQHFDSADLSKAFIGAQSPLDAIDKFRLLMAEWFRREHPNRSEKYVNDPWQELGLNSPRTELIPKRLFRLLGRICALHGATFKDVLSQLPHKEVGVANDDCHPRFVAGLLRLGDLLDMDDNRFCPVMQRIAGDNRPALSKAHEDKHNSIRHLRLNPDRIEISAVCDSVDGYVEQWRWLDYLQVEIQNQMAHWQDIAPSPALGLLPTLGEVKVDIADRQLITKPGKRPEFSLNSDRVMNLLRGENLYKHEDAIRELLQNAVDGTLLRVWLTSKSESKTIGNEPNEYAKEFFRKYPIHASLEIIENLEPPINAEQFKFRFTVTDQGVGISQEDLPYLMNVASSSANVKRQTLIDAMPEWLQPSGTFGIGLQSVFMWTDVVHIKTKSIFTSEVLDIALHSPTGPQHGLVTVEWSENENDYLRPIGTELSFESVSEKTPSSFSLSENQSITTQAYNKHDTLLDEELPITAYFIYDEILKFSKYSPIEIESLFDNFGENIFDSRSIRKENDEQSDFFSETNSYFSVDLESNRRRNTLRYRGQEIKDPKINSHYFFDYSLDLYAGKASDWLTFNRNSLTSDGNEKVDKVVVPNLKLWVEKHVETLVTSGQEAVISALARYWSSSRPYGKDDKEYWSQYGKNDHDYWQELSRKYPDNWQDLNCSVMMDGKATEVKTYRDCLKKGIFIDWHHSASSIAKYGLPNSQVLIGVGQDEILARFCVLDWCKIETHGIRYVTATVTQRGFLDQKLPEQHSLLLQLIELEANGKRLEIDNSVLAFAIEQATNQTRRTRRLLIPIILFPEDNKMERLLLKEGIESYGFQSVLSYLPELPMQHILLPFEIQTNSRLESSIKLNRLNDFVKWVHSNLKSPLSLDETKKACDELIDYIDNTVMANSEHWKTLRK